MEKKLNAVPDTSRMDKEFRHQWEIITRGAVDVLPEDEFEQSDRGSKGQK